MGTLFIIATPIGNLEDITLRALRVLSEADLIAAEDTRTTRALLTRHGIRNRLVSYNEHNMRARTPQLLAALDAGFAAVPVPGPSAVVAALAASGLPMREFTFLGFPPRRPGERRRA